MSGIVKPLEWELDDTNWWVAVPARMSFGYEVRITGAGNVRVRRGSADWAYFEGTADEAKAAFQADFDSLILSFVDPSYASSQAEIERLRTAVEQARDMVWSMELTDRVTAVLRILDAALSGSKE